MGNIRTKDIKTAARDLIKMYPDKFGKEFEANKEALDELKLVDAKMARNKVAGYITRLKKQKRTTRYRPVDRDERRDDRRGGGFGRGGRREGGFGQRGRGGYGDRE